MNMITDISPVDGHRAEAKEAPHGKARWKAAAYIGAPVLIGVLAWLALGDHGKSATAAPPPPSVTVATPLQREVTEWDDYVGRFAPSQTVEVRPRVSGAVTALHFRDGDIVRKGQLLFTIDPRPFTAALAEARANAASARSTLALARSDLARALRLVADEAVSAGEVDALRARVQAAEAGLAAADARVRQRALDVEFTQVRAPITGRVSDRRVDIGNLVASGEGAGATLLTTINALDPIYFTFDSSEGLYLKALRNHRAGGASVPVEVKLQDEASYSRKGRLDFTDNGLDPRSGTIRGRAVLDNHDLFLTPGMFGNMRLATGATVKALLIPDEAVQTDQARKSVLTVGADGNVVAKPVTLGPVVNGLRIIRDGLTPQDRVVISGIQSAMPGSKVAPHDGRIAPVTVGPQPTATTPVSAEATFAAR